MDEIEPKHLEEVLQTLEEEIKKMDPAELRALEEEIASAAVKHTQQSAMQEIVEEIQQLTPEERDHFNKRLAQEVAKLKPIIEKHLKEDAENTRRGYHILNGERVKKCVRQFIPAKIKTPVKRREEINNFLQENFSELLGKQTRI